MQEINALMRMYKSTEDQMSVSSYESTKASLQSIFSNGSVRKEVGKLLARPDYFDKMPEDLTEIAAYLRKRAYKDSQVPREFTIHRSRGARDQERAESDAVGDSVTPTTRQNFA